MTQLTQINWNALSKVLDSTLNKVWQAIRFTVKATAVLTVLAVVYFAFAIVLSHVTYEAHTGHSEEEIVERNKDILKLGR